jgi:hypothetical protein
MSQLRFLTATLIISGMAAAVSYAENQAVAPPAPRPFTVDNADGSSTTVTPNRGNARLSVQTDEVPTQQPEQKVTFLTNSAPRKAKTGYYAGAMLGVNVDAYQGNDITNWFGGGDLFQGSPAFFGGNDSQMSLGPMASLKLGYVWPFGESIDQFRNETGGLRLAGALEAEFVYLHGFHEYQRGAGQPQGEVQQITFAPMVNALLKGYFGRSEIYVGAGLGVASTIFEGDGAAPDSDSIGDLAYQFILGYEFHMNEEWSIFTESKYFQIQNMNYISQGDLANVLVGVGVKKQL